MNISAIAFISDGLNITNALFLAWREMYSLSFAARCSYTIWVCGVCEQVNLFCSFTLSCHVCVHYYMCFVLFMLCFFHFLYHFQMQHFQKFSKRPLQFNGERHSTTSSSSNASALGFSVSSSFLSSKTLLHSTPKKMIGRVKTK